MKNSWTAWCARMVFFLLPTYRCSTIYGLVFVEVLIFFFSLNSHARTPDYQARPGAPEAWCARYDLVRGGLQQSGGKNELVARGCTCQRRHIQLHQTGSLWWKIVHHTADFQRDARGGREIVHVPSH